MFTFSVQKKPCGARSDRHGRNVSIYFSLFPVGEKNRSLELFTKHETSRTCLRGGLSCVPDGWKPSPLF